MMVLECKADWKTGGYESQELTGWTPQMTIIFCASAFADSKQRNAALRQKEQAEYINRYWKHHKTDVNDALCKRRTTGAFSPRNFKHPFQVRETSAKLLSSDKPAGISLFLTLADFAEWNGHWTYVWKWTNWKRKVRKKFASGEG